MILDYSECQFDIWVNEEGVLIFEKLLENITAKTYMACAFAKEACRHLHRSRYIRMPDLLEMFNLAEQTGRSISSTVLI